MYGTLCAVGDPMDADAAELHLAQPREVPRAGSGELLANTLRAPVDLVAFSPKVSLAK